MRALPAAIFVSLVCSGPALPITQPWQAGWDNFSEPLNFTTSSVIWSVSSTTKALKVTFTLNGAKPTKLYQVGFHLFCTVAPAKFGRFPFGGPCGAITRQGTTASVSAVEFGVILTDGKGNGAVTVSTAGESRMSRGLLRSKEKLILKRLPDSRGAWIASAGHHFS